MKHKLSVVLAAALFAATPALAADPAPATNPFNCDFEPACEVAPGVYGNLSAPVASKFNLTIGGFAKLDYAYNSVNYGPNGFYTSTNVPKTSSAAGQKDQSTFSARASRLWFKSNGPTLLGGKTSGYLEVDFSNSAAAGAAGANNTESFSATPRLRHAYGNIDWGKTQLLFGQYWTNFGVFFSNNIDFNGGTNAGFNNGIRIPQVRLAHRIDLDPKNTIQLSFSVEQPYQTNFNNNGTNVIAGQTVGSSTAGDSWGAVPNFVGQAFYVNKSLGTSPVGGGASQKNLTIGLLGLYGNQHAAGQINDKTIDSWGAGFYSFVPVIASKDGKSRANTLSFEANAYLAANLNGYTAYQYTGTAGKLQAAKGFGVAGNLQYYATDQISTNIGYGRREIYKSDDYRNIANHERYNQTYYLNLFYDLNAAVRVGVEYQRFDTKYGNNTAGTSNEGKANIARTAFYYFF